MRIRECVVRVLAVLIAAPGALLAQSPAPDPARVGVINMNLAVSETAEPIVYCSVKVLKHPGRFWPHPSI